MTEEAGDNHCEARGAVKVQDFRQFPADIDVGIANAMTNDHKHIISLLMRLALHGHSLHESTMDTVTLHLAD
jgi:hypothetical protein